MNTEESLEMYSPEMPMPSDEEIERAAKFFNKRSISEIITMKYTGEKQMNLSPGIEQIKREEHRVRNHALLNVFNFVVWTVCVIIATVSICKWVMK